MDEYGELIDGLTAAGASDEEIIAIIAEQQAKKQGTVDSTTVPKQDQDVSFGEYVTQDTGAFNKTVTDLVPEIAKTAGIVTNFGGNLINKGVNAITGSDTPDQSIEENFFYKLGQGIEDTKKRFLDYTPNEKLSGSFWHEDIPQGLGSVMAIMLTGGGASAAAKLSTETVGTGFKAAAKLLAKDLATAPIAAGGIMQGVPEYDAAINAGLSEDEAFDVFLRNYFIGQTEAIPIENALKFINKTTGNGLMRAVKSGAVGNLEEAIQEGVQSYSQNLIAQGSYDPDRNPWHGVVRAMLAGATIGGGLGAAGGAASKRNYTEKEVKELQALHDAEQAALQDTDTGDDALNGAIDGTFAEIAARLDDIDIAPIAEREAENTQETAENDAYEFNKIEEENEITSELNAQEAAKVQAQSALNNPNEQELKLDDSEQTPAIQEVANALNESSMVDEQTPALDYQKNLQDELSLAESEGTPAIDDRARLLNESSLIDEQTTAIDDQKRFQDEQSLVESERAGAVEDRARLLDETTLVDEQTPALENRPEQVEEAPIATAETPVAKKEPTKQEAKVAEPAVAKQKAEAKPEKVKEPTAPKEDPLEKVRIKEEEAQQRLVDKTHKHVESARKLKPGKRLARLQALDEATLDNPEANAIVAEELDKLQAVLDEKEFVKQTKNATTTDKLSALEERTKNDKEVNAKVKRLAQISKVVEEGTEQETEAIEDELDQLSEDIESSDRGLLSTEAATLRGVTKRLKKQVADKLSTRTEAKKQAKTRAREVLVQQDNHLKKVAQVVAKGNKISIDAAVESYNQWRKDNGFNELTKERILEKASAEHYVSRVKSQDEIDSNDAKQTAEKEAEEKAKQAIRDEFGLSDDAIVDFAKSVPNANELEKGSRDHVNMLTNIKKMSYATFIDKIKKQYKGQNKFIDSLLKLLDFSAAINKKLTKNGLELYTGHGTAYSGAYIFDSKSRRAILILNTNSSDHGITSAHEGIHVIVSAILRTMASLKHAGGKLPNNMQIISVMNEFYNRLYQISNDARQSYRQKLLVIYRALSNELPLTDREQAFLTLVQEYVSKNDPSFKGGPLTAAQVEIIYTNTFANLRDTPHDGLTYMFTNGDELLAESLSDPLAMGILAMMESPYQEKIVFSKTANSYFRALVEGLSELMIKIGKALNIPIKPANNNYIQHLTKYIEDMEQLYLTKADELDTFETSEDGPIVVKLIAAEEPVPNKKSVPNKKPNKKPASNKKPVPVTPPLPETATPVEVKSVAATSAANTAAGPTLNKLTPALRGLVRKISNVWWKSDTIKTKEDVQNAVDKVNETAKINQLGKAEVALIWAKIEQYREELAEAKLVQKIELEYAKTLPEYKPGSMFQEDVDSFASVDISRLRRDQIEQFKHGIINLVNGGIPSRRAYTAAIEANAQQKMRDMLPYLGKFIKNPKFASVTNVATFATILAKYNKRIAQKFFNTFYGGLLKAKTRSQVESNKMTEALYDIAERYKLDQRDYTRAHMFGTAFSTRSHPNSKEYWAEVEANLDILIENSKNKIEAVNSKVYTDIKIETAKTELQIAEKLKQDIMKRRSMKGILSLPQQRLYDTFRSFLEEHKEDIERNAKGVWGSKSFELQNNFMPTTALGRAESGTLHGTDEILRNRASNNLWENLSAEKKYAGITAYQDGHSKEKEQPKGYYYDYNLISVANKYATRALFDVYATRELRALNRILNGVRGKKLSVNGKNINDILSPAAAAALNTQIKGIVGVSSSYSNDELNGAFKFLLKAKNVFASAMLGTAGQFIVQSSSAIPASLIMSPTGFPRALKVLTGLESGTTNLKNVKDFIEKNGLSIQLRDILFEKFQTVEDIQKSGLARNFGKFVDNAELATTHLLRSGDKFAARMVWFSEFFAAGGTLENPTKEAVLAAERQVGVLQNMSDISFSAPIFKSDNQAYRMLMQMFFAFKSFAMNSGINTYMSLRYAGQSAEARKVFATNMAMAASYHAAAVYLIKPFYAMIASALTELMGDDGDDEEENKNYNKVDYILANTVWDGLIGQISPNIVDALLRFQFGEAMKAMAKHEGEGWDPVTDSPIYTGRNLDSAIGEGLGVYSDVATFSATSISTIASIVARNLDIIDDIDDDEKAVLYYKMLEDLMAVSKGVPLRGDIKKILAQRAKQIKRGNLTGAPVDSNEYDGTDFDVTEEYADEEFVSDEYEYEDYAE